MTLENFNPNAVGIPNGNFFALPYTPAQSALVIVPVPWDVTTSYKAGAAQGPQAMIDASAQIDLFDTHSPNQWQKGIGTLPVSEAIEALSAENRIIAEEIINHLADGGAEEEVAEKLEQVNNASKTLNNWVYKNSKEWLEAGKMVAVVGGEHSAPLGLLKALGEKHTDFGILHIDAHADLRQAFEGFTYSHASIMFNALNIRSVSKIVQVAIRDTCQDEVELVQSNSRLVSFDDALLAENNFKGKTWHQQCLEIIAELPEKVYISFDIDGLEPSLCPNTGTPVAGGISFQQSNYLIQLLVESGRKIVGFDLCEVAPGAEGEWDANVGARVLFKLCGFALKSNN